MNGFAGFVDTIGAMTTISGRGDSRLLLLLLMLLL